MDRFALPGEIASSVTFRPPTILLRTGTDLLVDGGFKADITAAMGDQHNLLNH
jgi:hypothetical protein